MRQTNCLNRRPAASDHRRDEAPPVFLHEAREPRGHVSTPSRRLVTRSLMARGCSTIASHRQSRMTAIVVQLAQTSAHVSVRSGRSARSLRWADLVCLALPSHAPRTAASKDQSSPGPSDTYVRRRAPSVHRGSISTATVAAIAAASRPTEWTKKYSYARAFVLRLDVAPRRSRSSFFHR